MKYTKEEKEYINSIVSNMTFKIADLEKADWIVRQLSDIDKADKSFYVFVYNAINGDFVLSLLNKLQADKGVEKTNTKERKDK